MKYGEDLLLDLEKSMENVEKNQKERTQRISDFETDIDDCFLSINSSDTAVKEIKAKIEILKNKGVHNFEKLTDLEGNIFEDSRIINTKYGESWIVNGKFVNIPSFGCHAGKKIWQEAGYKNHAEAKKVLMEEINTEEFKEKNKLYFNLGQKAQQLGYIKKGYKVVNVERPAWITMKSGNSILHNYPQPFESDFNYYTGK